MSRSVRIGIVGTSYWMDFMFGPPLQNYPRAELAAKYDIPHVFTDYREMIARGDLDAVIIAVPDKLHHEITLEAVGAGLHVLCEKPLAMTAQQAREMYDRAEAAHVKHMVFFTYRWMPFFRYVRDLIEQGYIGRAYHCDFRYLGDYARSQAYGWRFDQEQANGVLGHLGAHAIDLARWLIGDFAQVKAYLPLVIRGLDHEHQDRHGA